MLELPEVLTLSKQANDVLSGKTITQVFNATKPHKFTFYSGDPLEYGKLLVRKTILSSKGYGMFVDFYLSGNMIMNIGDGVSARYYNPGDKVPANYQLLLTFEDESFLVFTVSGMYVTSMTLNPGSNTISLNPGIYIVDGIKVML